MSFQKLLVTALVAGSMTAAPALAAAESAGSLSVAASQARTGADVGEANELGGGGIFIPLMALVAVLAGVLVILDDDDADAVSP